MKPTITKDEPLLKKQIFYPDLISIFPVSKEKLATKHFQVLYGIRWQIELVFKNWKDKVSFIRKERIKCMIYTKLLFIFLSTKMIFFAKQLLWLQARKEISDFRASKQLLIMAF
ncbi:MAG: hypothetical protein DRR19_17210 [Candidatus Parabeggiatoa sp. nov. 1]|nr:MAG: hypothetical protein DRR19_17210 [Gammaproteobacteria bacterium]